MSILQTLPNGNSLKIIKRCYFKKSSQVKICAWACPYKYHLCKSLQNVILISYFTFVRIGTFVYIQNFGLRKYSDIIRLESRHRVLRNLIQKLI